MASLSAVEGVAGDLLSVVKVRSSEVHERGHRFTVYALLDVAYTWRPCQNWRKNGTGSDSGAVQPHRSPFFDLQPGWVQSRVWGMNLRSKDDEGLNQRETKGCGFTCTRETGCYINPE